MAKKKKSETESSSDAPVAYERRSVRVFVHQLHASPLNPRKVKPADYDARLRDLAASIAQLGVIEAPVVRRIGLDPDDGVTEQYEVLAGERRWRASVIAAETVPQRAELDVICIDAPDDVAFRIGLTENDQRDDMHPLDQCDAFVRMRDEQRLSVARIAALMGRTEGYVYERLRLEQLTDGARAAFIEGRITLGVALIVARIADADAQNAAIAELLRRSGGDPPSIEEARYLVKRRLMVIADAPFDASDASLTSAGACTTCPKRSEAQQQLFGDLLEVSATNRCTDPACWQRKTDASWERARREAEERGLEVADAELNARIYPAGGYGVSGRFVALDDRGTQDGRTWREVLAEQGLAPKPILARDSSGQAREVVPFAATLAPPKPPSPDEEKARAKRELERAVEEETAVLLRDAIAEAITDHESWMPRAREFWRLVARFVIANGVGLARPLEMDIAERFGIEGDGFAKNRLVEAVEGMPDARAVALIVDLLIRDVGMSAHAEGDDEAEDLVDAMCELLQVDTKAVKAAASKAAKARLKAREATATKGAA